MQIAFASGKGGTGKTSVAVNIAAILSQSHLPSLTFLDCDVEAPNAALFLHPDFSQKIIVESFHPSIDPDLCDDCGSCIKSCHFNALSLVQHEVLFFPELCHSCGACSLACPQAAISERPVKIGEIESGMVEKMHFIQGELEIGLPSPVPIIHQMQEIVKDQAPAEGHESIRLVDAPPGVTCPVVASLESADLVVLVTEPTPFGFHDLKQAVKLARDEMELACGVIINKDGSGTNEVEQYCQKENIPIIKKIPFDRKIAEVYSNGKLITQDPEIRKLFIEAWEKIKMLAQVNSVESV